MTYKTAAIQQGLLIVIGSMIALALSAMAYDIGRSKNQHLLDNCSKGIDIMHNGEMIRCGVINKEIGMAAARYRAVKNCVKLVKEWEDGN